jgi:hypothetical protein
MALLVWLISLPSMAIKKIVVVGNANIGSEEIQRVGNDILDTKYLGLFSKRNAFLYPKQKIAQTLTSLYPRISSVDLSTESFEILNIKIKERDAVSVWCAAIQCYLVDTGGYIFAEYHEAPQAISSMVTGQNAKTGPLSSSQNSNGGAYAANSASSSTSLPSASSGTSGVASAASVVMPADFGNYENLPKLYGGDETIGPEPIGKSIFTPKLYGDIRTTIDELQKAGLPISSVRVYSRDEIVFEVSGNGKLIFSDRKAFASSLEDLKRLRRHVFRGSQFFRFLR